jgi:hypothetical protein
MSRDFCFRGVWRLELCFRNCETVVSIQRQTNKSERHRNLKVETTNEVFLCVQYMNPVMKATADPPRNGQGRVVTPEVATHALGGGCIHPYPCHATMRRARAEQAERAASYLVALVCIEEGSGLKEDFVATCVQRNKL